MGLFDALNPLVKIAKSVVKNVMGQLTQQENLVQTAVRAPIMAMISEVTSGMWVGDGADAFVEQCTNMFVPSADNISSSIKMMSSGIGKALDIMEAADKKATGMIGELHNVFKFF